MSVVIAACAFVGALAGIAGSAAAPSKSKATQAQKAKALKNQAKAQFRAGRGGPGGPGFFGGHGGPGGGPVHSETIVPNADGTGFDKITTDAGKLTSVDGNTLNITEGTDKKKYKDVAIDVGSSPTVIRNRATAKLSDLKPDDQVHVIQGGPKGTTVIAEDAAFSAQQQKDHPRFGKRHGAGPPPGAPAPPPAPGDNQNGSDSSGSSSSGSNS
jgi:hypothetical protein